MAWGTVDVSEPRVRFVLAASVAGASTSALCMEFGTRGRPGICGGTGSGRMGSPGSRSLSRRPRSSPRRTEAGSRNGLQICARSGRTGARKLAVLLDREGVRVPAATVHRILLRRGLVRLEDRRSPATGGLNARLPTRSGRWISRVPKGWNSHIGPLSVIDGRSRCVLALAETGTTRAEAVRAHLERVFLNSGLPDAMWMDHGAPWWNGSSAGEWTRFSCG